MDPIHMVDHVGWQCPCGHYEDLDDDNCTDCGAQRDDDLHDEEN